MGTPKTPVEIKHMEARFLQQVLLKFKPQDAKIKHPILGVLAGQLGQLVVLLDNDEGAAKCREILDYVQDNWQTFKNDHSFKENNGQGQS